MNYKIKKALRPVSITAASFILLSGWLAMGQSTSNYSAEADKGPQAVKQITSLDSAAKGVQGALAKEAPMNILNRLSKQAGVVTGWDPKNNRWATVIEYKYPHKQATGKNFANAVTSRNLGFLGAFLRAQAALAIWYGADASVEIALSNPGDPLVSSNQALADSAKSRAEAVQKQLSLLLTDLSEAERQSIGNLLSTRFSAAAQRLLERIAPDSQVDTEARRQREELVAGLKSQIAEYNKEISELQELHKNYHANFGKKKLTSGIQLEFDHHFVGLSSVAMAERTTETQHEVAVLYIWSPKLAQAVTRTMTGDVPAGPKGDVGDMSFEDWRSKQNTLLLPPIGNYFDSDGSYWFYGVGMAADGEDAAEISRLRAQRALYLSMQSSLAGRRMLSEQMNTGEIGNDTTQKLSEELNARSDINTQGTTFFTEQVDFPVIQAGKPTTVPVYVTVSAMMAGSRGAANKALLQTKLDAARIARDNNRRSLEVAQASAEVKAARREIPAGQNRAKETPASKSSGTQSTASETGGSAKKAVSAEPEFQPGTRVTPVQKPNFE